jgi:hypothetical protein
MLWAFCLATAMDRIIDLESMFVPALGAALGQAIAYILWHHLQPAHR